jgi:hypothetical protein
MIANVPSSPRLPFRQAQHKEDVIMSDVLTRQDVIDQWRDRYGIDITPGLRFKVRCHEGNRFAPEPVSYYVSFMGMGNKRERYGYWPNSVGFQGM